MSDGRFRRAAPTLSRTSWAAASISRSRLNSMVTDDNPSDETFRGVIYYIDPAVDEKTRTVLMKMRIPNAARKLKAGLFATVRIDIGDFPSATVIPEESIVPQGGDSFVFVVENGVAHLRQIRIGLRQGGQVQVLSGIKPGDQVVVAGIQKIRDGAPVRVNPGS